MLALRSASRLSCAVPEAAVVNPGSSNITHEPASSSVTLRDRDGLSVVTLYSVPARTLVAPVAGKSLPLRLRTTGGCAGAPPRRPSLGPTPMPAPRPPGAAGAAPGAPPRPAGPPRPAPRPPPALAAAPIFIRPMSPLHTAAFQVGFTSQPSSLTIPPLMT